MKLKKISLPRPTLKAAAKYLITLVCMVLMNFALPQREPFSFPLYYAALCCGFDPLTVFTLYRRYKRTLRLERLIYLAVAQLPFLFLFPHTGYALFPFSPFLQKLVFSVFFFLLSAFAEGGLHSLLHRVFRCRLSSGQLCELLLLWLVLGLGVRNALGETAFSCLALTALLIGTVLLKSPIALPFALVLSVPLCFSRGNIIPLALFEIYASAALLLAAYGKYASTLAFTLCYLFAQFFEGVYFGSAGQIILALLPCVIAAAAASILPEKLYATAKRSLLFYREHALPRVAVNRNRRAVGERLYEVSSLFREIEGAFTEAIPEEDPHARLAEKLKDTLCHDCAGRAKCEKNNVYEGMKKLVSVGYAKGQVSLVDLPESIGAHNKLLATFRTTERELQTAREGRRLLAEQAHGVSEILKDIALEQSEEYSFSEGETALSRALAEAGIVSSEIFVYGEGESLTVSMTLTPGVDAKKVCAVAGRALNVPLSLSEKIPLTAGRACYILKRRPTFDAAFGIATCPKQGETACGDAYSILRIDERRFLIALSDGMGSGENARDVSDRTLSLLESFYKAKMPSETVLSTVNRLIAYSPEETFSCLDLAAVSLDTGDADIVKIGSPIGFILSAEELRVLEGESLPMGMLEALHPATMRAKMGENDFMLFMSDGVTSAFGSTSELFSYLSALRPINPQSLAEEVLKTALEHYHGTAEDDMTVLTVKLMKSA